MSYMFGSTTTATIANGESLSGAVDLVNDRLVRIIMSAAWTAAALTFQASADGTTYGNLYDSDGTEVSIASATAVVNRQITFTSDLLAVFAGIRYLKIRSGTSGTPVNQGAARILTLVERPL